MNEIIKCVTSASLVYWTRYGHRLAKSFLEHVPIDVRLCVYHEASKESVSQLEYWPTSGRIVLLDLFSSMKELDPFLDVARRKVSERMGFVPSSDPDERHQQIKEKGYNYLWDAVTFCKKGFAISHALKTSQARFLFWIDADVVFRKQTPRKVLEELMDGVDVAYFGRNPQHSETGFIGFDLKSPRIAAFTQAYWDLWRRGTVFELKDGWTDCHVFDAALRAAKKGSGLKARNLSSQADAHVIAASPFGDYIDHQKGPRKQKGFSPERRG